MIIQNQKTRAARLQALADEKISLKNRTIRAKERIKQLESRHEALQNKLKELQKNPVTSENDQDHFLDQISAQEKTHNNTIQKLEAAELEVENTRKALRQSEEILNQERENRAQAQGQLSALNEQISAMEENVWERLEVKPQDLKNHSTVDLVNYQTEDLQNLKKQRETLSQERNAIGAVNLRAEEESETLETELTTLLNERNDVIQAVDELRGGISKINREARERVVQAFKQVDTHFQRLFERLFRGGKAH